MKYANKEDSRMIYKVTLYGDLDSIPFLTNIIFKFKKCRDNILSYDIKVKPTKIDNYYGFFIDGNHRFLLGDFTVTHNTSIGVHLAKIWYALGYIKGGKRERCGDNGEWGDIKGKLGDIMGDGSNGDIDEKMMVFLYIILIVLFSVISYVWAGAKWAYAAMGAKWFFIAIGILLFFILLCLLINYMSSPNPVSPSGNGGSCADNREECRRNQPKKAQSSKPLDDDEVSTDDVIVITSREDFIAEYMGWTDKKTKKLLRDNMGKVVFIDEAYTLNNGYHDSYGKEAIDTLNRFMSENPDGIVVVMAGYKEKMQSNLFKAQPGLKRRFMWQFECKGYEIDELFEIWLQQIDPWKVESKTEAREVFRMYKWAFPNFAGDTLRLTNYVQIEHSRDIIAGNSPNENVLSTRHVLKGIQTLIDNNMDSGEGDKENGGIDEDKISEILETLCSMKKSSSSSSSSSSDSRKETKSNSSSSLFDSVTITELD
jgi:hypothetical protein